MFLQFLFWFLPFDMKRVFRACSFINVLSHRHLIAFINSIHSITSNSLHIVVAYYTHSRPFPVGVDRDNSLYYDSETSFALSTCNA